MKSSRSKVIKKLVDEQNMDMLIAIRNRYGRKTAIMNRNQVERAAKRLWDECNGDWKKITVSKSKVILNRSERKAKKARELEAFKKTQKLSEKLKEEAK